jgi:acetylornithine deacetylase/succinyl-diaminopimelate desuccinylase-like protein
MINGHINTVTPSTHTSGDPLSEVLRNGCIYGRRCRDMKAGVAARTATRAHGQTAM